MSIAVPAASALRDEDAFVRLGEIVERLAGVVVINDGSDGDFDFEILAVGAVPVAALSVPATVGAECVVVTKL